MLNVCLLSIYVTLPCLPAINQLLQGWRVTKIGKHPYRRWCFGDHELNTRMDLFLGSAGVDKSRIAIWVCEYVQTDSEFPAWCCQSMNVNTSVK